MPCQRRKPLPKVLDLVRRDSLIVDGYRVHSHVRRMGADRAISIVVAVLPLPADATDCLCPDCLRKLVVKQRQSSMREA